MANMDTMRIELVRIYTCPTYTIGKLYVDGEYVCDVIEDTDRGLYQGMPLAELKRKKVKSLTAIPTGTYPLTMTVQSPKFAQYDYYKKYCKGYLPRLLQVDGFEGVLIHCGSSAASSAGCLICGFNRVKGRVVDSRKAWEKLMKQYLMPAKVLQKKITITITTKYKKK